MSNPNSHQDKDEGAQPAPSFFDSVICRLSAITAGIGALMVVFMLVVIGYSVVQRYFFGTPVTWTDELTGYLVVAIVMFGAGETLRRDEHITVDLWTAGRSAPVKKMINIWGNLAVIVVAVVLLISTKATLSYSYNFDILSNGYLEVPMWIPQSSLLVGGVLLILVALVRIFRQLSGK